MKKLIVTVAINLSLCAADKEPLLPAQTWTDFQTQHCSVRLSTAGDYTKLFHHFCSPRSRFRFGVELTDNEMEQIASSWKTSIALWMVVSNWFPESFFGRLMVIEKKDDKTFLGACGAQEEKHAPILALLEPGKKYMNVGIGVDEQHEGKGYPVQIAHTLIPMLFDNRPDVDGIVVSCSENHPILKKSNKREELEHLGFKLKGLADFPQGLTSLVPQKPVRMVTYLLKREDCLK